MEALSKPGNWLSPLVSLTGTALLFASTSSLGSDYVSSSTYATGDYRMVFSEYATKPYGESLVLVHPLTDVDAKIKTMYDQLFKTGNTSTQRIVFDATGTGNTGLKFVKDIGSNDIRSEGMSYGMMIAVMMDDQATFDALWGFARKFMYNDDNGANWYAWSLQDSAPNYPMNAGDPKYGENPAPDGEEYFAMALFFADHRWGSTGSATDLKNYKAWANNTLTLLGNTSGNSLWDAGTNMVKFSPFETFTDPSYHLPAFYQLWGLWADNNKATWSDAADKSRAFLKNAVDDNRTGRTNTGLFSEYASYSGVPQTTTYNPLSQHSAFDAYRVINNIAMDHYWWSKNADMNALVKGIMGFYNSDTELATAVNGFRYTGVYGLGQGSTLYMTNGNWSTRAAAPVPGLAAMNAVGAVANDESYVPKFVQYLWDQTTPSGGGRYYDGLLHLFGYLHLAGYYRIYNEFEGNSADLSMSTGRQDANNNPIIFWGAPNYFTVAGCPQGQSATGTFTWTMAFLRDKDEPLGVPDFASKTGNMTALSNGRYFGEIPILQPAHDEYTLTITRKCNGVDLVEPTSGWVDPSGYVRTVQGYPLPGSTVTLFKTDTNDSASTLRQVPNGSIVMAPRNRKNPDQTDFAGHFGWDVSYGYWYRVTASHPGCVSPTNPLQTTVQTPLMFVPPEVTNLDIRLACPTDRLKVETTITSDWGTGYCADLKVTNNNSIPVNWNVKFNVDGNINSSSGPVLTQAGRVVTAKGPSGSTLLPAFGSTTGNFCATRDRKPSNYTIIVRARGTSGAENINLTVGGTVVGNWNLTTSLKDYYVTTQLAGGINVVYTNDNGVAYRDVVVDFVDVNNVRYQTEDMTQNTSVYGNGRCGGGSRSEWMHCSGWVGFPAYK